MLPPNLRLRKLHFGPIMCKSTFKDLEEQGEVPSGSLKMVRNAVERSKNWPKLAAMRINKALTQAAPGPGAPRGTRGIAFVQYF